MTRPASHTLLDRQLVGLAETIPTLVLSDENISNLRLSDPIGFSYGPGGETVARTVRQAPGAAGAPDVRLVVYQPPEASEPLPCILHMHGGGYVGGSANRLEPLHRLLVEALNCVLVSVDYRLAPEHPFPAAIDDCYASLAWVFANARELGVDTARVGVMGESAGAGLAASLALMARDRGEYELAFQHLIYPMIDDRTCVHPDPHPHVGEYVWTPHNNRFGWRALLGVEPGSPGVSPYAAAARAENLEGLPPAFIYTGALDLFLEENMEYARRLIRARVPTELHVYPGAFHGFDLDPNADISATARGDSLAALAVFMRGR